jgi:acyl dehydratase
MSQAVARGEEFTNAMITDEKLEAARAKIGQVRRVPGWNSVITKDTIWHFAMGVGDDNPLWWDEDYGKQSPRGGLTAPPCYLYSHVHGPVLKPEDAEELILPDVMALWASERWDFKRNLYAGEQIHGDAQLSELIVHEDGTFGGRSVSQVSKLEFKTEVGEVVAECRHTLKRFNRSQTRARGKYLDRPTAKWGAADREQFEAHHRQEARVMRRGAEPRYLESTRVGERTPTMLKGPLTRSNLIGWQLGIGLGLVATNRMVYAILDGTPGTRMVNPDLGCVDTWAAPHWEPALCRAQGLPGEGYDHGCQRLSWVAHFVSDWMGDHGFLRNIEIRLMRPNIINDVTWIDGEVVAIDYEAGTVILDIRTTNQLEETTSHTRATVELPRRP